MGGVSDADNDDSETVELTDIEAVRVRVGWPVMGSEIVSGETLPAATGVVKIAVSFTKGCYPGQELVERMDSRGSTAPKTLRLFQGSHAVGAVVGKAVLVNGAEVGVFTSVTAGFAMGYVARAVDIGVVVGPTSDSVE